MWLSGFGLKSFTCSSYEGKAERFGAVSVLRHGSILKEF